MHIEEVDFSLYRHEETVPSGKWLWNPRKYKTFPEESAE